MNASPPSHKKPPDREARVAEALRENLRKRKAQAQSRAAAQQTEDKENAACP
ncbi:MAG: hypothetical protein KGI37_07105 [Alphaproteobacteria bacterium]|nr:hypothetical protein [Alphaproteobacteria bacterium]